jgi:hypothetical protein
MWFWQQKNLYLYHFSSLNLNFALDQIIENYKKNHNYYDSRENLIRFYDNIILTFIQFYPLFTVNILINVKIIKL